MTPESMDQIENQFAKLRARCIELAKDRDRFARLWQASEESNLQLCDQIEDLRKSIRSRDLMIEELRSLIGGAATQRPEAGQ